MKKMIDLIAGPGTGKDSKLLDYVRRNYFINNQITNLCFISGQGEDYEHHVQPSAEELRKLVFEDNNANTMYFFRAFYFDKDRANYLKLIEDMCNHDIQIFKTDQVIEHVTDDKEWTDSYCIFLTLDDIEKVTVNN